VAVVDEQHRFGVRQRVALDGKARGSAEGLAPHVLHMTATPIPRTMRLAAFGALDVTAIKELPRGRQPIATHVVSGERERARAYERIREELRRGRQAFVVCPLVEESREPAGAGGQRRVRAPARRRARRLPRRPLHGQMRSRDKQAAMAAFAAGDADVLVATTVIEVGIDVPNATVIVVEDAERYASASSTSCGGASARRRAVAVPALRAARLGAPEGPGRARRRLRPGRDRPAAARGGRAHRHAPVGMARFSFAQLPDDAALLERAHACAAAILAADPELARPEHDLLGAALAVREGRSLAA